MAENDDDEEGELGEEDGEVEEEGELEMDEDSYGAEERGAAAMDEEAGTDSEGVDEFLDDQDSEDEARDQIKIPSDIEDADEEYGQEDGDDEEGEGEIDEDEEFGQFGDGDQGDAEDEVFALAKENNEMRDPSSLNKAAAGEEMDGDFVLSTTKKSDYVNKEMVSRIEKLEEQMVGGVSNGREAKSWQLTGEVSSKARPLNSLLEQPLDFNTVSKLPPTITQEKSTSIEALIK
jgi:U3 small nucleolar RNA-associated protein MPP10